jgi:hypothetical protein
VSTLREAVDGFASSSGWCIFTQPTRSNPQDAYNPDHHGLPLELKFYLELRLSRRLVLFRSREFDDRQPEPAVIIMETYALSERAGFGIDIEALHSAMSTEV